MTKFVKILTPRKLRAEDLSWLLDRCDSMLEDNVCRCVTCEQYESFISDLRSAGYEHEELQQKPMPKPLPKYVRIILGAWLRDQEAEWRQFR